VYRRLQKALEAFERAHTQDPPQRTKKISNALPLVWPAIIATTIPGHLREKAEGSKFRDLDGNEYIGSQLDFGALMAGHCHPA